MDSKNKVDKEIQVIPIKKKFNKPELRKHASLPKVTNGFASSFSP